MAKPVREYFVRSDGKDLGPFRDLNGAKSKARAIAHGGRLASVLRVQTQTLSKFVPQPRPDPVEILEEES